MVASVGSKTNTLVLVERFLGGREFCIAVMGAGPAGAFAFSPVERCLEQDEKVGRGLCYVLHTFCRAEIETDTTVFYPVSEPLHSLCDALIGVQLLRQSDANIIVTDEYEAECQSSVLVVGRVFRSVGPSVGQLSVGCWGSSSVSVGRSFNQSVSRSGALCRCWLRSTSFNTHDLTATCTTRLQVFTSMDVKAITAERVRPMALDGDEADLVARLQSLGVGVYSSLNLTSLVRLDIRADEDGELYILVSDRLWLDLTAKWGNLVKLASNTLWQNRRHVINAKHDLCGCAYLWVGS